jgi:hypothetical protein
MPPYISSDEDLRTVTSAIVGAVAETVAAQPAAAG